MDGNDDDNDHHHKTNNNTDSHNDATCLHTAIVE